MRGRALAAGLSDPEIEVLHEQARDQALAPAGGSTIEIYRRLLGEAIVDRGERGADR